MRERRVDRDAVLAGVDIVDVVSRYLPLKRAGAEYQACCPFHEETTPSFSVNPKKQFYYCFGCGASGDAIRFVTDYCGVDFLEAVKTLGGELPERSPDMPAPEPITAAQEEPTWMPTMPVPETAPGIMDGQWTTLINNPKRAGTDKEWTRFKPVMVHPFRDVDGNLLGYVLRMQWPKKGDDGKVVLDESGNPKMRKITPQVTYCVNRDTGEEAWAMVNFPEPRPLYGLDTLTANPKSPVILPEGEKCQEAARRLLPKMAAVSWPGGGKGIPRVDWSPLAGRNVIVIRDADLPGYISTYGSIDADDNVVPGLAQRLLDAGVKGLRCVEPPEDAPDGWDIWDAERDGWSGDEMAAYIKTHNHGPLEPYRPEPVRPVRNDSPVPDDADDDVMYRNELAAMVEDANEQPGFEHELPAEDMEDEPAPEQGKRILTNEDPIRPLGYDHGSYFYLAKGARQVVELTAGAHSKLGLMSMAGLDFWGSRYPKDVDTGAVAWDMAANAMLRACEDVGVFDPDRLRGRGAWWDSGKSVLHLGDHLVVDGTPVELAQKEGRYIYEAANPMRVDIANPLTPKDASVLLEICKNLQWEKSIDAYLLAGWVFLAPICGALGWRPHIWLTGGAGSGKTWCMTNVISRVTGQFAVQALSSTTEAGIRQKLGHDARPVLFDEAEGEDQQAQQRIQNVMQLIRQASSETGGEIFKGSSGGRAQSFRIRSMFAFASIGVAVHQYADKTRVTVLQLRPDLSKPAEEREAQFHRLESMVDSTLTEEYVERLHARAVRMIGVIRANARTFAQAGARVIGQQRLGDQIGALIAGAYALHSNKIISLDEAQEWIGRQDWSEEFIMAEQRDESACLARIMEHVTRTTTSVGNTVERSVGELVRIAVLGNVMTGASDAVEPDEAAETLSRLGIRAQFAHDYVTVSNTHSAMAKLLRDTPWPTNWGRILKRLPGAEATEKPVYFSGGSARGVNVPLKVIFE